MKDHINRKILTFAVILSFVGAGIVIPNLNGNIIRLTNFEQLYQPTEKVGEMTSNNNYTHTVFVGVGTSQICTGCHDWTQYIHDIYSSELYDFEYVEMIVYNLSGDELNENALKWANNHSITTFPTSIFDGNYERINGTEFDQFTEKLDNCGYRPVKNITANITVLWMGNATIKINISIKNNEEVPYDGHIRAFISEIVSRYTTYNGSAFHFGFLDFAFDKKIQINAGGEYTDATIWDGKEHEDLEGNNFGDITANNTQVTLVVYNNEDGFVDKTVIDRIGNNPPNEPSDPYPENGAVNISLDVNLSWTGGDPNGDLVTYNIRFGNSSPPPKIVDNQTNTFYEPDTLDFNSKYFWQIVAWDEYNASTKGPIWNFTTLSPADLEVAIIKPLKNYFHLRNFGKFNIPFGTIVYGPIDIEVNASSSAGIEKVEFFINKKKEPVHTDDKAPYTYKWKEIICGVYTLKVKAYDNLGEVKSEEITVLKWRAHPFLILAGFFLFLKLRPKMFLK
jgi:hypothetical protein